MLYRTVLRHRLAALSTALMAGLVAAASPAARAEPKTVCTVTINSADERETFQRFLPRDQYRVVELVQRGQPDWLAQACRRGVTCDALVISGHFDDGTAFYNDTDHDKKESILHLFIPLSADGLRNEQCRMFEEQK